MKTVIGLFESAREAQQAAQKLYSNGFTSDNVDVSVRGDNSSYSDVDSTSGGTTSGNSVSGSTYGTSSSIGTGDLTGSANLTGSTAGAYNYGDSNDGEGLGGKVSKFFKNLFGSDDDEANRYSHVANKTGNLVTVHASSDEEAERAADILDESGAINVDDSAAQYGYEGTGTGYTGTSAVNTGDDSNTLKVIKEDIQVGKREVETGGVKLRSRIVARPVEEQLRLREERVTVERKSVDRPASATDIQNFKEGVIEMTETAEVPVVQKTARVVEEVKLSKEVNERTETISETAHDTEVDVEDIAKNDLTNTKNKGY